MGFCLIAESLTTRQKPMHAVGNKLMKRALHLPPPLPCLPNLVAGGQPGRPLQAVAGAPI